MHLSATKRLTNRKKDTKREKEKQGRKEGRSSNVSQRTHCPVGIVPKRTTKKPFKNQRLKSAQVSERSLYV